MELFEVGVYLRLAVSLFSSELLTLKLTKCCLSNPVGELGW